MIEPFPTPDVTHVYDDVTHVYDDVTHVYDDVTYAPKYVTTYASCTFIRNAYVHACLISHSIILCMHICNRKKKKMFYGKMLVSDCAFRRDSVRLTPMFMDTYAHTYDLAP